MFSNTPKLQTLNLSNLNLSKASQGSAPNADDDYMQNMFESSAVNNIIMENSYADSINKIINKLPTRTSDSTGVLRIAGIDDSSQVDVAAAESKYWIISI
jgi:surface protein